MQSIRTFNPNKLNRNIPEAPPPPPLSPSVATPTFQIGHTDDSPSRTNVQYVEDNEPSHANFVATGSPYLKMATYPGPNTTNKNLKSSASFPIGEKTQKSNSTIPPPPPLPHLPIRRQPSDLLREIRKHAYKRRSGHNLGAYQGLKHVETVEKRAFRVGKVIGEPIHVVTTQDLVKSFNRRLLNPVNFSEPVPSFPVGREVRSAPVHVPKMKAHFSPTKKSGFITKKRAPGKLKKSPATAPEDELPRIPTPPPLENIPMPTISTQPLSKKPPFLDDVPMPTKSKQPMSKKSAGLKRKK